jgi:hypothetical protein
VHVADYPALRAYSGAAQSALITGSGIAGTFVRDATVTVDNGGTEIVGVHGWRRVLWENTEFGRFSALGQSTAPTVAVNPAPGNLNGTYRYAVTFVTADGESECGAETGPISPANQQVNLTNIPISTSSKVTARRIYRTAAAAADIVLKQLVVTINDNTTTTYTDNVADGSLGASVPRIDTTGAVIYRNSARIASASQTTTVFGFNANPNNTGYANTAFGAQAMMVNTTGYRNCAFGIFALSANTTGARNTAVGVHSVGMSQTVNDNTGIGYGALQTATAGNNTAVGSLAMSDTTTGDNNVAVGFDALQLNRTGSHNTAVGAHALQNTTSGQQNTAVGRVAMQVNTTGNFNAAIGMYAGLNTNGSNNTFLGFQAGYSNNSGNNSVFVGSQAGYWETSGQRLYIDVFQRTDLADAKVKALIYGEFNAVATSQVVKFNANVTVNGALMKKAPVVVTSGAYTVLSTDAHIVCNNAGTVTLTLPAAASFPGREITVRTTQNQAVVSVVTDVLPITSASGVGGTAILAATAGKWAVLVSDGAQWHTQMAN